jgi:hypothetical protein
MAVSIEQIKPGAVFRFKNGPRRITGFGKDMGTGFNVKWEYADGKKRNGRLAGSMWVHYFRAKAIEQIPDPAVAGATRRLLSGREVPSLEETVEIKLNTYCPDKWVFVDLETGDMWWYDGTKFLEVSFVEAAEVAAIAKQMVLDPQQVLRRLSDRPVA